MNDIRKIIDILEDVSSDEPMMGDVLELELNDVLIETTISEVLEDGIVISVNESILSALIDYKKQLNERMVMGASTDAASSGTIGEEVDELDEIKKLSNISEDTSESIVNSISRRIMLRHTDLLSKYGQEKVLAAINDKASDLSDVEEIGSSDVSNWVKSVIDNLEAGYYDHLDEAKYQGREVPLGKPMKGDVAKSKVYVRGPKGNVVKVNFGDKKMRIKKSNPARRKSFRARHNCDNPGPRWKARYWSCRAW
jgi:hypothetical protein